MKKWEAGNSVVWLKKKKTLFISGIKLNLGSRNAIISFYTEINQWYEWIISAKLQDPENKF